MLRPCSPGGQFGPPATQSTYGKWWRPVEYGSGARPIGSASDRRFYSACTGVTGFALGHQWQPTVFGYRR